MASKFNELYSDYQDSIKLYTEKLDFTERMFMRQISKGMQKFQRETHLIETMKILDRGTDGNFYLPGDVLLVTDIADDDGNRLLQQSHEQYLRNQDKWPTGKLETPTDYILRTNYKMNTDIGKPRMPAGCCDDGGTIRLVSIWSRRIYIYPEYTGDQLFMKYIPDIHAFSENSDQWNTQDAGGTPTGWFPDSRFDTMFRTTSITPTLAPYEDEFVSFAISRFIMGKGSANYKVYENKFMDAIAMARIAKPIYFAEGTTDYFMAPWS